MTRRSFPAVEGGLQGRVAGSQVFRPGVVLVAGLFETLGQTELAVLPGVHAVALRDMASHPDGDLVERLVERKCGQAVSLAIGIQHGKHRGIIDRNIGNDGGFLKLLPAVQRTAGRQGDDHHECKGSQENSCNCFDSVHSAASPYSGVSPGHVTPSSDQKGKGPG